MKQRNKRQFTLAHKLKTCRVCPKVQFYAKCAVLVLINFVQFYQLQSTAMRCYAPDPAGELTALPRPPGWILGEERNGKGGKMEREEKERASGGGKERTKEGRKEKGKEREKVKGGGKRTNFVQL